MLRRERTLVGITAAAALLRFPTLGLQSYWYDETVTAGLLRLPFGTMVGELPDSETAPPLYYVVAWVWGQVFGTGEVGLRALSALAGTATVPVAAAAAALVSRRAAVLVALLAASSPVLVWYSQEARSYALAVLLAAVATLLFGRAVTEEAPPRLAAWAAVSCLAVWTSYFAVPLVAAQAALLVTAHGWRRIRLAAVVVAGATLLVLPLAASQGRLGRADWIADLSLSLRAGEALRQLAIPSPAPPWAGAGDVGRDVRSLWLVAAALLALALVGLARRATVRERHAGAVAAILAAAVVGPPLVLALAATLLGTPGDVFLYRALLPAWLPVAVLLATGLAGARTGRIGPAALGVLAAASVALVVATSLDGDLQRDDWPRLAGALDAPLVVVSPDYQASALRHDRPELRPAGPMATTAAVDVLVRGDSATVAAPPGFRVVESRRIQHWRLTRLRAATPRRIDLFTVTTPRGAVVTRAVAR